MIEINNLSVTNEKNRHLLNNVSLSIQEKTTTLICGKPGSGKTLLLKSIKDLISNPLSQTGDVKKDGKVGIVFQNPGRQIVREKVKREVVFDLENRGLEKKKIFERVQKYASLLDADHLLERKVRSLSNGETTKVALLSTLVTEPDVILLDEPLSCLDQANRELLLNAIDKLKEEGITLVIAEHDIRDLIDRCDKVVAIKNGEILSEGDPKSLKDVLYQQGIKVPFDWELDFTISEVYS